MKPNIVSDASGGPNNDKQPQGHSKSKMKGDSFTRRADEIKTSKVWGYLAFVFMQKGKGMSHIES